MKVHHCIVCQIEFQVPRHSGAPPKCCSAHCRTTHEGDLRKNARRRYRVKKRAQQTEARQPKTCAMCGAAFRPVQCGIQYCCSPVCRRRLDYQKHKQRYASDRDYREEYLRRQSEDPRRREARKRRQKYDRAILRAVRELGLTDSLLKSNNGTITNDIRRNGDNRRQAPIIAHTIASRKIAKDDGSAADR